MKKMKVCLFGTYNAQYGRNSSMKMGLVQNGVEVTEVQKGTPIERMELPEDFTLWKTVQRAWWKFSTYASLLFQIKAVLAGEYIFVLHPGHLDLPLAWILKIVGRKKLIFDTSISPYDTMFIGRSIADRKSLKAKTVKLVEGLLLRLPDKLFVDTEKMKELIVKEFNIDEKKIFVVPLGANDAVYKPGKKQPDSNKTTVLFFGLYNPFHGTQHIMKSIQLLQDEKNVQFIMLGDGYLKESLIEFKNKNRLSNVKFVGFMPEEALVKQIQSADILLGTFSNNPVFQRVIPNKVFAALACKKPLITAKMPPLQECFTHKKHLYFCEPENPESLAAALRTIIHDSPMRTYIAQEGYDLYRSRFTTKHIGQTLKQELEKLSR